MSPQFTGLAPPSGSGLPPEQRAGVHASAAFSQVQPDTQSVSASHGELAAVCAQVKADNPPQLNPLPQSDESGAQAKFQGSRQRPASGSVRPSPMHFIPGAQSESHWQPLEQQEPVAHEKPLGQSLSVVRAPGHLVATSGASGVTHSNET